MPPTRAACAKKSTTPSSRSSSSLASPLTTPRTFA